VLDNTFPQKMILFALKWILDFNQVHKTLTICFPMKPAKLIFERKNDMQRVQGGSKMSR